MLDFTVNIYKELLRKLSNEKFSFQTFSTFIKESQQKTIILRHDVDLLPQNSLQFARIQAELGLKGSYYFRAVPESWDDDIIQTIASLGHEVGYHYENMDTVASKFQNSINKKQKPSEAHIDAAYDDFCMNLEKLRKLVPVTTICMHGSPKSKYDNKSIWSKYNYNDLDIIGEPYYDVDFDKVFYLTDTGRRWDGWKVSVRDKVIQQDDWNKIGLTYHSTKDIIDGIKSKNLPDKIMMTFHPQRWTNDSLSWSKELIVQNLKNAIKYYIINRQ